MQLNPQLLHALETPELKRLLLWFETDTQSIQSQSERLDALLSEVNTMQADTCYQTLSELALSDMVRLTILNEFGPEFAQKTGFPLLETATHHRLDLQ